MKSSALENLRRRENYKYHLVAEGVLIGIITGALISVFRLMLVRADELREELLDYAVTGAGAAVITAILLVFIALIIAVLLDAEPDIAGSGIPQVEAELKGQKDMCWYCVILAKTAGCALAIGGGLALGREGPSIQLGAMVGKGVARGGHRLLTEERLLVTCGAGAGLSAAFGAPLAGAIFTLEELHHNFSAEVLLSTLAATTASVFVAANVFGLTPVFGFDISHGLPLKYYWAVVLMGIILGFFGILYNKTIGFMQDLFDRIGMGGARLAGLLPGLSVSALTDSARLNLAGERASRLSRMLVIFAAAFLMMFFYPLALGSGSSLVGQIGKGEFTLQALIILLLIKFIYSTASFGSGSPGGIFLPLLVLGAVSGGLFGSMLGIFGLDQSCITAFVVIGMAGYFSAIVRSPVTGVILITEMTGDFTCLLPLVIASLIAYLIAEFFGIEPIYEQLLHRSQRKSRSSHAPEATAPAENYFEKASGKPVSGRKAAKTRMAHDVHEGSLRMSRSNRLLIKDRKTIIEADVHLGSYMDGRSVMEFGLPLGTLIISVMRDGAEIIPDGHTILRGGDTLEILMRERDISDVESIIEKRCHAAEMP